MEIKWNTLDPEMEFGEFMKWKIGGSPYVT
jgi:hypothetical protein